MLQSSQPLETTWHEAHGSQLSSHLSVIWGDALWSSHTPHKSSHARLLRFLHMPGSPGSSIGITIILILSRKGQCGLISKNSNHTWFRSKHRVHENKWQEPPSRSSAAPYRYLKQMLTVTRETAGKEVEWNPRGHVSNDLCWRNSNANFGLSQGESCPSAAQMPKSRPIPLQTHWAGPDFSCPAASRWWVSWPPPQLVYLLKTVQHWRRGIDVCWDPRDSPGHSQGSPASLAASLSFSSHRDWVRPPHMARRGMPLPWSQLPGKLSSLRAWSGKGCPREVDCWPRGQFPGQVRWGSLG